METDFVPYYKIFRMRKYFKTRIGLINFAVILLATIFFVVGNYAIKNIEWSNFLKSLSIELLGAGVLFYFANAFFGVDDENRERETKINEILDRLHGESSAKVFPTATDSKYNKKFYQYFNQKIRNANNEIYITGEGFSVKDDDGLKIAKEFLISTRYALDKGVSIIRYQTKPCLSKYWNDELKALLRDYPQKFKLCLSKSANEIESTASICSIDYSDNNRGVSEFMVSIKQAIAQEDINLAGLAVFVEGDTVLNLDIKNRILGIINDANQSIEISLKNFDLHMDDTVLYFTYGSNMDEVQIVKRTPSAKKIGVGLVKNYELVFNRKGSFRKGGVASIVPNLNKNVYGMIYSMSKKDILKMDKEEDPEAYERKTIIVETLTGVKIECEVYISFPQGNIKANQEYLKLIIAAAKKADLPADYISSLEKFKK